MTVTLKSPRVGIRDVAREAGVSITTVSHALSGRRPVPEATRTRVLAASERLGYRPNPAARSLTGAQLGLIGIAFAQPLGPFAQSEYYLRMLSAAASEAIDQGFALVAGSAGSEGAMWYRLPVDGAIMVEPIHGDAELRALRSLGVPIVLAGRDPEQADEGYLVDNDSRQAVRMVLDHLSAQGASTVGVVVWDDRDQWQAEWATFYREWCEEHGRSPSLEVVPRATVMDLGDRAIQLLRRPHRPQALFTPERVAVALLLAARQLGVGVPDDLLLAATRDVGVGETTVPSLTTIDFAPEQQGAKAVQLLLELVRGETPSPPQRVIPVELQVRESSVRL
jgi:DNA-binding LacI/PurR family transcriptional regulator